MHLVGISCYFIKNLPAKAEYCVHTIENFADPGHTAKEEPDQDQVTCKFITRKIMNIRKSMHFRKSSQL